MKFNGKELSEMTEQEKTAFLEAMGGKREVKKVKAQAKRKATAALVKAHQPEYDKLVKQFTNGK